jgi:hypothetical protein
MLSNKKQQAKQQQALSQEISAQAKVDIAVSQYQKSTNLHMYVWGLMGIWLLFVSSFALAFWRVAQNEKFSNQPLMNQPLNSIDWSENQKAHLTYPEPKKK